MNLFLDMQLGDHSGFSKKFLSDSEISPTLLQYVLEFRTKLTGASGLAKANWSLHTAVYKKQIWLKHRFKPDDKVFAVLPVSGKLLQFGYFRPYTSHKKMETWQAWTETCMPYQYVETLYIKSDKKSVYSVNIVSSDPAPEKNHSEQFETTISPAKLENPNILNNLVPKPSYLQ